MTLTSSAEGVLVNVLPYRPAPTGLSRYVERLIDCWPRIHEGTVPLQLRVSAEGQAELSRTPQLPRQQRSRWMRVLQSSALVQHGVPVRALVAECQPELIYSPYTDYLFAAAEVPQVITCHDLTPLYWPSSRRAHWRSRLWLPRHLHAAQHVIAISRHVADLLVQSGVSARRITVIANGVEAVACPLDAPQTGDVLVLARHARNKNIALALQGFSRFLGMLPGWEGNLIIVGGAGRETPTLQALAASLGIASRVQWRPHLDAQGLEQQWKSSWALLSSSVMEGFDYPILEAQVRGLPTLASRIPVHEELHADVSLLFDLNDDGVSLAAQLRHLAQESGLWQQLSLAGLRNARSFTIDRQCRHLSQLLTSLMSR